MPDSSYPDGSRSWTKCVKRCLRESSCCTYRADFGIWLEAPTRRLHLDARRFEWIVAGEQELAPVLATFVRRVRRTAQDKVPVGQSYPALRFLLTIRGCCLHAAAHSTAAADLFPSRRPPCRAGIAPSAESTDCSTTYALRCGLRRHPAGLSGRYDYRGVASPPHPVTCPTRVARRASASAP